MRNQIASMPNASANVTTPSIKPAQSQRGQADEHADDRGGGRGEQGRDRERDTPVDREVAEHEAAGAGEGELRERDLTGVAGDHHERQGEDREDDRVDHRGPGGAAGHEQRDRADGEAGDDRHEIRAWSRGLSRDATATARRAREPRGW